MAPGLLLAGEVAVGARAVKDSQYWDDVGEDWSARLPDSLWRSHSDAVNSGLLKRWVPEGPIGRVLKTDLFDEACTDGLAPFFAERGATLVGMDISAATIGAALRRRPEISAVFADVRSLPFASGGFDLIVSNSTLDHFRTPEELVDSLAELNRVLRPGGRLVLTLDNPLNPAVALRNALPFGLLNKIGLVPYFVGTTCGPGKLRRLLEATGFRVDETTAALHCPRALAVIACRLAVGATDKSPILSFLTLFEGLERLPTRFLTGYFVAASATKA